ncbi:sulfurtransferase [Halosimplex litoreum]|uniref:Sulfurtransferase n=1 Tax=Halosimplex litoreum TaxID=1198301 RepID=A0A7T3FXQ7_9EURY|nr:sulfurtransferase [Halosimplex litoreum]QPV62620.1 sulfurtransferase [Halosimplex litoreum]
MTGRTTRPERSDALVSPEWVDERLPAARSDDPSLRLVEVDLNTGFYDEGHLPGAVGLDWRSDLRHDRRRDVPSARAFADLLGDIGITEETTVVAYGDNANWFAAHFYWLLTYYGHDDAYLLDGGREHWVESDRPTTTEVPSFDSRAYRAAGPYEHVRAYRDDVARAVDDRTALVDVRLPEEFDGTVVAPPGMDEFAQRGGHVPGAVNVVWSENVAPDGRFKSRAELEAIYRDRGVTPDRSVVVYCRIGERSSLTWFVLSELLGYPSVRNYDGSWTEWGNLVDAPIETGRPGSGERDG